MPETAEISKAEQSRLRAVIETLFPGYFALVMATGIVSLAAHFLEFPLVAITLFWANVCAYLVLWALTLARLFLYPRTLVADLAHHGRGPGFFTLPAGTCVLGVQFAVLRQETAIATALWFLAIGLWILVTYGFFASVTLKEKKPSLAEGLNGAWLIAIVATQAIAVLGSVIAPNFSSAEAPLLFATAMHMAGFMLYLPLIALLLYRWTFFELTPQQLTPPYWINMGALAISALAGARLLQSADRLPLLQKVTPFLQGTTFFCWTAATWWIPLLLVFGFWRHIVRRVPLTYDPQYWGMVFPLGMYTVCTIQTSRALELPSLMAIAKVFLWAALTTWVAVAGGLLWRLVSAARSASQRDR